MAQTVNCYAVQPRGPEIWPPVLTIKSQILAKRSGTHLQTQHSNPRQGSLCKFQASPVYTVHSRTARATQQDPVSKRIETSKQLGSGEVEAGGWLELAS